MMIKPAFLRPQEISDKADEFRQTYVVPPDQVPLSIEHVIENVLKIRIDPRKNLSRAARRSELAIDSYLTYDRSMIVVDYEQYIQDQGRLRFTLAHELGHWFLHQKEYALMKYETEADFIRIQTSLNVKYRAWFEFQANEFAAVLLVPTILLSKEVKKHLPEARRFIKTNGLDQLFLLKYGIAEELSHFFDVSNKVVNHRMNNEQILETLLGI